MDYFKDITNQKFSRLTAIKRDVEKSQYWHCVCDCGNKCLIRSDCLKNGNTKSCGCLFTEMNKLSKNKRHGMTKTTEYTAWVNMRERCYNSNRPDWGNYGGRGIKVCDRWLESFENFFNDMGKKPHPNLTIERINNNGNYEPSNCKWVTRFKQSNNQRSNIKITYNGKTLTTKQWSIITGIKRQTIQYRLKVGWSVKRTLTHKKFTHG